MGDRTSRPSRLVKLVAALPLLFNSPGCVIQIPDDSDDNSNPPVNNPITPPVAPVTPVNPPIDNTPQHSYGCFTDQEFADFQLQARTIYIRFGEDTWAQQPGSTPVNLEGTWKATGQRIYPANEPVSQTLIFSNQRNGQLESKLFYNGKLVGTSICGRISGTSTFSSAVFTYNLDYGDGCPARDLILFSLHPISPTEMNVTSGEQLLDDYNGCGDISPFSVVRGKFVKQ